MSWLAHAFARVDEAGTRLTSAFARLVRDAARIGTAADAVVERVGERARQRDQRADDDLDEQIAAAFRERRFDGLSRRAQRRAAGWFDRVAPDQMHALLVAHPAEWRTFASDCFRRWDTFADPNRPTYAPLLARAPADVGFLHANGRIHDLVGPEGHLVIAQRLAGPSLTDARLQLEALGFDSKWAFSCVVLALWAWRHACGGASFDALCGGVAGDVVAETMLLPQRRIAGAEMTSWFGAARRQAAVRSGVHAQALFVAALLRAARGPASSAVVAGFTEALLQSDFGDPRVPPPSRGWHELERLDPEVYRQFFEQLISEDLEIFFEHAMNDPRRKRFWLRYLSSIRRTTCIFDQPTHARLRHELAGADRKLAAALARARRFRRAGRRPHAFCLYFDSIVVVEFSESGNAAFIYARADFERRFEAALHAGMLDAPDELKDRSLAHDRIIHVAQRWEAHAEPKLAAFGIVPDRPRRSHRG